MAAAEQLIGTKVKTKTSVKIAITIGILYTMGFLSLPFLGLFPVSTGSAMSNVMTSLMKPQNAIFEEFVQSIEKGDTAGMNAQLDEQLRTNNKEALTKIIVDFKNLGGIKNIYMLGGTKTFSKTDGGFEATYWADFEKGSELIKFSLKEKDNANWIDGFNYSPTGKSYSELYHFPLWNISIFHYVFAIAAFFLLYFSISTLILCLESDVKVKWLWIIFICVGIGTMAIVWRESPWYAATFKFNLTSIVFFSASAEQMPMNSPMLVKLSLPLGAIIFRLFLKNRKRVNAQVNV